MSDAICSPDPKATRSHAADWLELMALTKHPNAYYAAEYISSLSSEERDPDADGGESDEDEQIMDSEFDALLEAVTDELAWRSETLGARYPFDMLRVGRSWSLAYRPARGQSRRSLRFAHDTYVACLLMSGARYGRLAGVPALLADVKPVSDAFQATVYLLAPALLGGPAFWIGFPRPGGEGYADALERYVSEVGVGVTTSDKPPSQKSNKDGGVDIISWRQFDDRRSNLLLSYGQVASGQDWRDKSVKGKLDSHFHRWLGVRPVIHYIPVMYIPHMMHEAARQSKSTDYETVAQDNAHTLEGLLGLVVDRIRMTSLAADLGQLPEVHTMDWPVHTRKVYRWLRDIRASIRT